MKIPVIALLLISLAGCAGGRVGITAYDAKVPVSMSRGVRDQNGELVSAERRVRVGKYEQQFSGFSIFYSLVPLSGRKNLAPSINQQVEQVGGDAVINLRVSSRGCILNYFVGFNLLPIWPGCTRVTVEGDIIKVLPKEEIQPPAPPVMEEPAEEVPLEGPPQINNSEMP